MILVLIIPNKNWVVLEKIQNLNICCYITAESRVEKLAGKKSRWTSPQLIPGRWETDWTNCQCQRFHSLPRHLSTVLSSIKQVSVISKLTLLFQFKLLHLTHPQETWRAVYILPFCSYLAHCHIRFSEELWVWEPAFPIKRETGMKMLAAIDWLSSTLHRYAEWQLVTLWLMV